MHYYHIAVPCFLDKPLTYMSSQALVVGQGVLVPLGTRTVWGIVWQVDVPVRAAKEVMGVHPLITLSSETLSFLKKAQAYTLIPLGMLIRLVLPSVDYASDPFSLYQYREAVTHCLTDDPRTLEEWKTVLKKRLTTLHAFVAEGSMEKVGCMMAPSLHMSRPFQLSAQQKAVAGLFVKEKPFLIQGVTGSGKTELALSLADTVWTQKQQVLILVPEINLCSVWIERIQQYYSGPLCVWHSGLSGKERQKAFDAIIHGHAPVIIGARSAVFLPYKKLGMIIVDEEHEPSYKQEEGQRYHGRDMAVLRAHYEALPCVLLSATPCIETLFNVDRGTYIKGLLEQKFHTKEKGEVFFIDMRAHKKGTILSPPLQEHIHKTIEQKQQVLLFLNKRGYAPVLLCYQCGWRSQCPSCDVCLCVHKKKHVVCHYCGHQEPLPEVCKACSTNSLLAHGLAIEKVQEEVHSLFPDARVCLFSSDQDKKDMQHMLQKVKQADIDILIGTQLIAKGHHFPLLTTIGIIDADFALGDMDFRAQERLFQVLSQVTGRAGREKDAGVTFVQTLQPQHPFFRSMIDPAEFLEKEKTKRQICLLPPFIRMVAVIVSGKNPEAVEEKAMMIKKAAPSHPHMHIMGPVPAPISPLRGQYRYRFLIKAPKNFPLQEKIHTWLSSLSLPQAFCVHVDVDPYTFL